MIPIFLDMRGWKVVVFGGGPVGRRKAAHFYPEAEVVVVTRVAGPELKEAGLAYLEAEAREVLPQLLLDADLVVAATDDRTLNRDISRECAKRGIPCNRADAADTFLVPSMVRRDRLQIAISTLGHSPAMSRYLRMQLDEMIDARYEDMIRISEEARALASDRIRSQEERERILRDIVSDEEIWGMLGKDPLEARQMALRKVTSLE